VSSTSTSTLWKAESPNWRQSLRSPTEVADLLPGSVVVRIGQRVTLRIAGLVVQDLALHRQRYR